MNATAQEKPQLDDYRTQTRIKLKAIEVNERLSEETNCYAAKVYFDGKLAGEVGNHGHGGCDNQYPHNADRWRDMLRYIGEGIEAHTEAFGDSAHTYIVDLEMICNEQIEHYRAKKQLRSLMRKRVIYIGTDYNVYQTNTSRGPLPAEWPEQIAKRYDCHKVLNTLDIDEAAGLFRRCSR